MSDALLRFTVAEDRRLEIAPEMVTLLRSYAQHGADDLEAGGLPLVIARSPLLIPTRIAMRTR